MDDQVSALKKEVTALKTKLRNAEEKVKEMQSELEARTSYSRSISTESSLREQLRLLNEKYDTLKNVKERAAERYKADFKKWRAFNDWLFAEDTKHNRYRNEPGITREEKKKREMASIARKKQMMVEIGPDLARFEGEPGDGDEKSPLTNVGRPPPLGRVEMDSDKENEGTPVHKKRRISAISHPPLAVPMRNTEPKNIGDYSAFKGRGRYGNGAKSNQLGDTTINAQYTIDPTQNEGLNYQYDQVVRNKDERRRLDAGDCECCHEYYEGVGPLPSGLQPPLWRSPTASPVSARTCLRQSCFHSPGGQNPTKSQTRKEKRAHTGPTTSDHNRRRDIESHKKAISRHRHAWARAITPPGYWDIGFPNTQAVVDINEQAKQMHKRKKARIDKDAENGVGKYRRR